MWFEQILRKETGCATYMVGSTETGECVVFDPLWDTQPYHAVAKKMGSKIRYVIDSHSHADHVSGARRLEAESGADLLLPEASDVTYDAMWVNHGDRVEMGEVVMEFVHTPGHRPEQMCLLITDKSRGDEPWCMLTADCMLVGDLARPDLAQSGEEGAKTLYNVTIPRLNDLPDFVEVYPGHVAGST